MAYQGRKSMGTLLSPSRFTSFEVYTNGLDIDFSRHRLLTMVTEDGIARTAPLERVVETQRGFTLYFKYNIRMDVENQPPGDDAQLLFTVPSTTPPVKSLNFWISSHGGYNLQKDKKGQISFTHTKEDKVYYMDSSEAVTLEKGRLSLNVTDQARIALRSSTPLLANTVVQWLESNGPTTVQRGTALASYKFLAYQGWKERYSVINGSWKNRPFSERGFTHYLSEAYRQGEYRTLAPDLVKSALMNPSQLSWYSSPFTGNIIRQGQEIIWGDIETLLWEKQNFMEITTPTASPYKEYLTLLELPFTESSTLQWVRTNLYPLIYWINDELFLIDPATQEIDVSLSLNVLELLKKLVPLEEGGTLPLVIDKMYQSLFGRGDGYGVLPQRLAFIKGSKISLSERVLYPEEIFSLFQDQAYAPRFVDLSRVLPGEGWLFTAAQDSNARLIGSDLEVSVRFPVGSEHYFIIQGVEPFRILYFRDIDWPGDPNFQRYSDGYYYDSLNKTLYAKMRHKTEWQSLRIVY